MIPALALARRLTSAAHAVLALLAVGVGAYPASAQTEVGTDATYTGPVALTAPLAGIAFSIPDGFRGAWDGDASGLTFESPEGMLMGIWGWSEGTVAEVAAAIDERLREIGVQLQARPDVEMTEERLTGTFDAYTAEGNGVLRAAIRRDTRGGNVFAVAVLGAAGADTQLTSAVDEVLESLEFGPAEARSWRSQAEGSILARSSSGSDMSSGVTTATGASSSQASIALCRGAQYRYVESSETYVSIEGMSASSSSSDEHAGEWWLSADLGGNAILTLEAADGRLFYWSVREADDGWLIDGDRFRVTGSC